MLARPVGDPRDELGVGRALARPGRSRRRRCGADLEPVQRVGERVEVVRGLAAALDRHDRRAPAGVARAGSSRRVSRVTVTGERRVDELVHPRAGGDDDGVGVEVVRRDPTRRPARRRASRAEAPRAPGRRSTIPASAWSTREAPAAGSGPGSAARPPRGSSRSQGDAGLRRARAPSSSRSRRRPRAGRARLEQRLAALAPRARASPRAPPAPAAPTRARRTRAGRSASGRGSTRARGRARTARRRRRRAAAQREPSRHRARAASARSRRRRRRRITRVPADAVPQHADPLDLELDDVAGLEPAPVAVLEDAARARPCPSRARRRAAAACSAPPARRAPSHEWCMSPSVAARALLAVHARDHRRRRAVELVRRDDDRAEVESRSPCPSPARARRAISRALQVARRPVVHEREPADRAVARRSPRRPRARSRAPPCPRGTGSPPPGPKIAAGFEKEKTGISYHSGGTSSPRRVARRRRAARRRRSRAPTAGAAPAGAARRRRAGTRRARAPSPPPVKNACSVCAASWTTRSPSIRPGPAALELHALRAEHAELHALTARCGR